LAPDESVVITWNTIANYAGEIRYAINRPHVSTSDLIENAVLVSEHMPKDIGGRWEHRIVLDELKPGETYAYICGDEE
jgi:hypothetical protein